MSFSDILVPTLLMGVIALVLFIIAYRRGDGAHIAGLKIASRILLQITPLLIFAIAVAGLIQVLIPTELVSEWVGTESGLQGVLIGAIVGGFMPGGPFVSLPIAAALLMAGAGIGTMVAFLTGWSLLAVSRLPLEVGLMGWRFTAIRLSVTFFLPVVAGLLANLFFSQAVIID
ncbi:MAG: permease [Dehalococcoidales bacterium]